MSLPPQLDIQVQLSAATAGWRKMRRVSAYASFDGWTLALLGAITLVCDGYSSPLGLLVSLVLLGAGIFELANVRKLRKLNPKAIVRLAGNQLALAAGLIAYALLNLIQARHGGGLSATLQQTLAENNLDGASAQLSSAVEILYTGLIGLTILVQGATALYYFSRQKHFQRYLRETPDWIQQMQRERGEVTLLDFR